MAEVKVGTACSWGVGVSITTPANQGRVISSTHTKGSNETLVYDEAGDVSTMIWHGQFEEIQLEVVPTATTYTTPAIGDSLVIADTLGDAEAGTADYYITAVSAAQVIGDVAKLNITAKRVADINT